MSRQTITEHTNCAGVNNEQVEARKGRKKVC